MQDKLKNMELTKQTIKIKLTDNVITPKLENITKVECVEVKPNL